MSFLRSSSYTGAAFHSYHLRKRDPLRARSIQQSLPPAVFRFRTEAQPFAALRRLTKLGTPLIASPRLENPRLQLRARTTRVLDPASSALRRTGQVANCPAPPADFEAAPSGRHGMRACNQD